MSNDGILSIYYDERNRIRSNNKTVDNDLTETLNLNFEEICNDRLKSYNNIIKNIFEIASKMNLSKLDALSKALRSVERKSVEFSGFYYV